jgi:nitrite reductase (NADH) small subunit
VPQWVRLCSLKEAPISGAVQEAAANGVAVCLANLDGQLHALGNVCPHRGAPLAEGWIEDGKLVCPWHAWIFDLNTGCAEYPEGEKINVFQLRIDGDDVQIVVE